jgi:hypothetical protein
MFTAYRAKAAEFRAFLTNAPRSPKETSEFLDLEQTYALIRSYELCLRYKAKLAKCPQWEPSHFQTGA